MNSLSFNSPPQMCGFFSVTSDREYDNTASALRYFKEPTFLPLDLNEGLDSIKKKPETYFQEKMDTILHYIVENKIDLNLKNKSSKNFQIEYITYRGVLRKILELPYSNNYFINFSILATKYKNKIYLGQLTKDTTNENYRQYFYGPKFEQYCLTENPHQMPDLTQDVDACIQFFGVFKRKLVNRNFLFAGEMDGIVSNDPINLEENTNYNKLKFIELKVTPDIKDSFKTLGNFRRNKIRNVWLQSYLTGVNDIYFGMRNSNGMISRIDHYNTNSLLRLRKNWEPETCFDFLNDFLKLVETEMANIDCPHTVFEFHVDKMIKNVYCTEHHGKTDLSLLPDWYLEFLQA